MKHRSGVSAERRQLISNQLCPFGLTAKGLAAFCRTPPRSFGLGLHRAIVHNGQQGWIETFALSLWLEEARENWYCSGDEAA